VLVLICAIEALDREDLFALGREVEDFEEDSVVEWRFGFEFEGWVLECREEVLVRGLDSWYPESWRDIFIASNFGEDMGVVLVGEEGEKG
jgi:hypothetical protein